MTGKTGAASGALYLHILVLAIVIVSELIGIQRLPIGIGTVIFLPIVLAYTAWVYRVLWGRVTSQDIAAHPHFY